MYCDNQSIINLTKHQVLYERSKDFDVKLHFVSNIIANGSIKVENIPTKDKPIDMLTKALSSTNLKYCLNLANS